MNDANIKVFRDVDSVFKLIRASIGPLLAPSTVISTNRGMLESMSHHLSLSAPNIPEAVRLFGESIREQLQQRSAGSVFVLEIPRAVLTWMAPQAIAAPISLFSTGSLVAGMTVLATIAVGGALYHLPGESMANHLSRAQSWLGLCADNASDDLDRAPGVEPQTPKKSGRSKILPRSSSASSGHETASTRASTPATPQNRSSANRQRAKSPRIETPETPEKKVTRSGSTLSSKGKAVINKRAISAKSPLESQKKKLKTPPATVDSITGSMAAMGAQPGAVTDHQNIISPKHGVTPQLVKRGQAGLI